MRFPDKSQEILDLIKTGYNQAAVNYQKGSSSNRLDYLIYKQFKSLINGKIIELGCGDGYPIGIDLLGSGFDYTGIDLSEKQIELAKLRTPNFEDSFLQHEMISYCKEIDDNEIGGFIAMNSIFHLPRIHHTELFDEIYRILKPEGVVIFTCAIGNWQGYEKNWLGAERMFWSNFSNKWYEVTLVELGFTFVSSFRNVSIFNQEEEIQYLYLFKKLTK